MDYSKKQITKMLESIPHYDEWKIKTTPKGNGNQFTIKVNCQNKGNITLKLYSCDWSFDLELDRLTEYFKTGVLPLTYYIQPYTGNGVENHRFGELITIQGDIVDGVVEKHSKEFNKLMRGMRKEHPNLGFTFALKDGTVTGMKLLD